MASSPSTATGLNPEPSEPEERRAEGLPPKSYKAAAEEALADGDSAQQSYNAKEDTAGPKKPQNGAHKANGLKQTVANLKDDAQLELEKYESTDGDRLTSTTEPQSYYSQLDRSKKEDREQKVDKTNDQEKHDQLASGKHPGQGWHRSAIRWAPLNVPLQRRLQTAAVLWHGISIAFFLAVFFLLCSIPLFWPFLVPYMVYCLFSQASMSGELSHRSERFRRSSLWSLFASYYPARLHRSEELPATRKYIFGYHPHGIISHGAFASFATEALGFAQLFPGITNTLLTLDANFRIPIYRDYLLALGLASVSRESCENLLNKGGPNREGMGRAITIVVGGARESLDAQPHVLRLVLKRRKGFIKLAIRNGADLVPVLGFGENELYEQFKADDHPYIHKMQMLVKRFLGFTVPLFHARGIFNYDIGLLPYRRPVNVVVGRPIYVEQQQQPDPAYVDEMHERYTTELQRLWDEWKDTFAKDRRCEMELVE